MTDDTSNTNLDEQVQFYISTHQGRTFVLYLDGEFMLVEALKSVIKDFATLTGIGIKLVVVTGARPDIEQALKAGGVDAPLHDGHRPTSMAALVCIQDVITVQRLKLESLVCAHRFEGPGQSKYMRIASGNYVTARPLGVIDGVDYGLAGQVRRVRSDFIRAHLAADTLVHIDCLGYASTGEVFNLNAADLAASVAVAIGADKLIMMTKGTLLERDGAVISELNPSGLEDFLSASGLASSDASHQQISAMLQAARGGVPRVHALNYEYQGALFGELFSHKGTGTQITVQWNEKIRQAGPVDISGIQKLIGPLERDGVLVPRSREQLEQEISRFVVVDMADQIVGCASLYPLGDQAAAATMGELACLATHHDYERKGIAEALLTEIERQARAQSLTQLCTLTTQASHWFMEQGFAEGELSQLPAERQSLYNLQRGSKVLLKTLSALGDRAVG